MLIKTLIINLIIFLLLIISPIQAYADDFSLGIYPVLSIIQAQNDTTVSIKIELENFSDKEINLSPSFREFKASDSQNGHIEFIPNSPTLIKLLTNTTLSHNGTPINQVTIAPSQKLIFDLNIMIPKETPTKDYTFSVIFIEDSEIDITDQDSSSVSYLKGGIASNIILSFGENDNSQAIIEEFSTQKLFQQGPVPFKLIVRNPGNHIISPTGVITIRNVFGQLVGKIELDKKNILAGSGRSFSNNPIDSTIWPEKFLLGPYQANLQLSVSQDGPHYSRDIYFLAFPYQSIVVIVTTGIFIIFIAKRVSKHLSS